MEIELKKVEQFSYDGRYRHVCFVNNKSKKHGLSELFYNEKKDEFSHPYFSIKEKLNEIKIYEIEYRNGISRRYSCFDKNGITEIGFHKNGSMNWFGEIIHFGKESRIVADFCNILELGFDMKTPFYRSIL